MTIRGNGKGGRNQEMLLAFMLEQQKLPSQRWVVAGRAPRWVIVSGAFDGIEGNSECMGAILDSESLARAQQLNINLRHALDSNDSTRVFRGLKDTLVTGHTQTNVNGARSFAPWHAG